MASVIAVAVLVAVLGVAFCLAGYRFFLVMLPIWGFFAGLWLGAWVVVQIFGSGFLATVTGLIIGFLLGAILAVLSYLFYLFGVALVAFGAGAALGSGVATAIGFDSGWLVLVIALAVGLVAAGLTLLLNLQKYVIILISAVAGGNLLVLAGLLLFGQVTLQSLQLNGNLIQPIVQGSALWLIVWLVLVVLGVVIQIRTNRGFTFSKERFREGWG